MDQIKKHEAWKLSVKKEQSKPPIEVYSNPRDQMEVKHPVI